MVKDKKVSPLCNGKILSEKYFSCAKSMARKDGHGL